MTDNREIPEVDLSTDDMQFEMYTNDKVPVVRLLLRNTAGMTMSYIATVDDLNNMMSRMVDAIHEFNQRNEN